MLRLLIETILKKNEDKTTKTLNTQNIYLLQHNLILNMNKTNFILSTLKNTRNLSALELI